MVSVSRVENRPLWPIYKAGKILGMEFDALILTEPSAQIQLGGGIEAGTSG